MNDMPNIAEDERRINLALDWERLYHEALSKFLLDKGITQAELLEACRLRYERLG